jgi:hypothetical protein
MMPLLIIVVSGLLVVIIISGQVLTEPNLRRWERRAASWSLGSSIGLFVGFALWLWIGHKYRVFLQTVLSSIGFQYRISDWAVLLNLLFNCIVLGGFSVSLVTRRKQRSDSEEK